MIAPSGAVPRELIAGIVWESSHEQAYVALANEMVESGGAELKSEIEAFYVVHAGLCRRFTNREVKRAVQCVGADAKRKLMAEWTSRFGAARALNLATCSRESKLRDTILREW